MTATLIPRLNLDMMSSAVIGLFNDVEFTKIHTGELPSNIESHKQCAASDIAFGAIAKKVRA
jgi:hypothetical protein